MSEQHLELLDEVVRLLAVLVRRTASTQREAILELSGAGLKSTRVAELLGTTAGTVTKEISRTRGSKAKERM